MTSDPIDRLRAICLVYPEAIEAGGVGNPSFKVRGKIFAMQHSMDDRPSLWVKAPPGMQEALVETDAATYFRPPYVGHHGWVGVRLDVALDWEAVTELIDESYRMTAPKRLVNRLPSG